MRVLGIDPGIAATGYGLLEESNGRIALVEHGVITSDPALALPNRLREIHQGIKSLISRCQPQAAAVEKLFFSANAQTAMNVGQARGVVLLAFGQAGIPVHEYTPLEVKQSIVGYGRATKHQVQELVRTLLALEAIPKPDDAADAIAVALCHLHEATWMRAAKEKES